MLDSDAAMSVCLVDYLTECGIQPNKHIELQAADGSPVEHSGSKDVLFVVGNEAMTVTSVKAPILSLAALEDAGWRLDTRVTILYSVVVIYPCRWTGSTMSTGSSAWRCWAESSPTRWRIASVVWRRLNWNASRCEGQNCCPRNTTSIRGRNRCRKSRPLRNDLLTSSHLPARSWFETE